MKRNFLLTSLLAAMAAPGFAVQYSTNVIFADDFESGAMGLWTATGSNPLDPSTAQNAVPPSPGGQWSAYMNISTDRMHRNLIADNGGSEVAGPALATWYIYDPGSTAPATRIFNEVRGYSGGTGLPNGGTTVSGSLAQLLAAGKYNTVTLPGETYNGSKYQARAGFTTNSTIYWFNLNDPGSPNRSPGWHRFDVERLPDDTTIRFYVDGVLSRTASNTVPQTWDTLIMGPGLGTTVGDAWIDGMSVSVLVPDTQPPSVTCPPDNTITASGPAGAMVNYVVTATDNLDPSPAVSCAPPSGSTFPVGTTLVTCTATDQSGNSASCSFNVTVLPPVGNPCFEPDDGTGTAKLPPAGCQYLSPDEVHMIIDGLPSGTTIELAAIHKDFICREGAAGGVCSFPPGVSCEQPGGSLGGEQECAQSTLQLDLNGTGALAGFSRRLHCPISFETHIGPRVRGQPVQSFDTDMFRLQGQLPPGDPDFDLLRITAGTDFGLPSPGHTILTRQPDGTWAVDSFFDITYRIDFVGAPGGPLAGMSGSTTGTIRMVAAAACNLAISCPPNQVVTGAAGGTVVMYPPPVVTADCAPVTVDCVPPSGSAFPFGITPVTCTATDAQGNAASCTFEVIVRPPGDPCLQPDNGTGTVTLPPPGCEYLSPDQVHLIIDGLPPGTTIELAAIHKDFICRSGGGTVCSNDCYTVDDCDPANGAVEQFGSTLRLHLRGTGGLAGWERDLTIPNVFCQSEVGPRTVGDPVQSFATEMRMIQGQITGDPDFDLLRVTAGTDFGLPSPGHTTLTRQPDGTWAVDSFFDITYRIDFVGAPGGPLAGMSGSTTGTIRMVGVAPRTCQLSITCPADQTVVTRNPAGAVVAYPAPVVVGTCPPISVVCAPPSGSPFPVGVTAVTCMATDAQGGTANCSFKVKVRLLKPRWQPGPNLPPPQGEYISPQRWHQLYANGIIISNVSHRRFTQSFPPPPAGGSQVHTFGSTVEAQLSQDGGMTWTPVMGTANVAVQVTHAGTDADGTELYDTEMLSLDLVGPGGLRLRESPTRASTGRTNLRSVPGGGFMIDSFFDVFTEISLDGGTTWSPAEEPAPVELGTDPRAIPPMAAPAPLLPPLDGAYVSPQQYHLLLAQGIVIRDVRHKLFTQAQPPPVGGSQVHTFGSQVDLELSQDGGNTFQRVRAPATVAVHVQHRATAPDGTQVFDTEMLALDIQGGDLPSGVMIRESPTRRSEGGTAMTLRTGNEPYRIQSFFDVFTELSVDGGLNWVPADDPARVELKSESPTSSHSTPNLPPPGGEYISPQDWHALYAQGIIISNVSHRRFLESFPPPSPGVTETHTFWSVIECDLSTGVGDWTRVVMPAEVTVALREMQSAGNTRYFETEMLALNLSGPGGIMIRESPTRASLGRTTLTSDPTGGPARIASFFDVFTELSVDGGQTWSPSLTAPATVTLRPYPTYQYLRIDCPADITVSTANPAGAAVNFTATAVTDCFVPPAPGITVSCNPPSGSLFPVGTTPVTCTATDNCHDTASCSFNVTVNLLPIVPVNEHFFPVNRLPPPNGLYISPQRWHQLYANGIIIRDVKHRRFVGDLPPPPPPGGTQIHQFDSLVELEASTDGGTTFVPLSGQAAVMVQVTDVGPSANGGRAYDTEMLQLDLTGGTLPPGVMIRESPTRSSLGRTTVREVPGGFMIDSFFDIFTELSVNGGQTWSEATESAHVELRVDPTTIPPITAPTPVLPPRNDAYVSPAEWHAAFAQGIIISNVSHRFFTQSLLPPPPGASQSHVFDSHVDFMISQDGGQTWRPGRAPAAVEVAVISRDSTGILFDTEMLTLNVQGGDLPPGVMLRESPSEASGGGTQIAPLSDGTYRIHSFFDVFTELSVDGGQNWSPASNGPVRVQLTPQAPEQKLRSPNLPPRRGEYISPQRWHALYAQGIIISNVSHKRFTESLPPPPPGGTQVHTFGSVVQVDLSADGGRTFNRISAPANVAARVTSAQDVDNTRYFDTEMLSLTISLPGGAMLRESPTRASLGRTSIRQTADGASHVSSFFDIFTELSTDGGNTWTPSDTGPAPVAMRALPDPKLQASPAPLPGQLILEWPLEDTESFVLRRAFDLSPPIEWQTITVPIETNGPNRRVVLPMGSAPRGFFQLFMEESAPAN